MSQLEAKTDQTLIEEACKAYPQFVNCPSCNAGAATHVENKISMVSGITCFFCVVCWSLFHIFKKRDLNCYDSEHKCGKCQKDLFSYKSC